MTAKLIPWNDVLGGAGELAIQHRLTYFASPTKPEPPYNKGIDFWCELCENGLLSAKMFFVQAKGTQHFDDKWGRSFDRDTIEFWLSRPFPVYIIVYDDVSKECYWMSIEEQRNKIIERMSSKDTKTVYLTVDKTRILRLDQNPEFVQKIKDDSMSMNFRFNLIRGTPEFPGEGYVREIRIAELPPILLTNIRERIRINLDYLIHNHLFGNDIANAYALCELLTRFDRSHYDHFVLLGRICRLLGKKEEACSSYREAIEICKRDKNWNKLKKPTDQSIEDIIASIEAEMKSLGCESAK